jgi:hypothetical protein
MLDRRRREPGPLPSGHAVLTLVGLTSPQVRDPGAQVAPDPRIARPPRGRYGVGVDSILSPKPDQLDRHIRDASTTGRRRLTRSPRLVVVLPWAGLLGSEHLCGLIGTNPGMLLDPLGDPLLADTPSVSGVAQERKGLGDRRDLLSTRASKRTSPPAPSNWPGHGLFRHTSCFPDRCRPRLRLRHHRRLAAAKSSQDEACATRCATRQGRGALIGVFLTSCMPYRVR